MLAGETRKSALRSDGLFPGLGLSGRQGQYRYQLHHNKNKVLTSSSRTSGGGKWKVGGMELDLVVKKTELVWWCEGVGVYLTLSIPAIRVLSPPGGIRM
jgi:hypothetical protein